KRVKPAKDRSVAFRKTRRHHVDETAEDYCELIADLIKVKGEARTCTIAEHLGISHVTAVKTLGRLQSAGYVTTSRHKPVELTEKGKKIAKYSKDRHQLLVDFLMRIGVPQHVAEIDVEGAEHHLSKVTLKHIKHFLKEGDL
ncbi:MAG: hypothetical protein KDD53_05045, partial [Bdellovibrionales bacterium]|nr:hypothetical protein [Bdellovibrionales bacterium]